MSRIPIDEPVPLPYKHGLAPCVTMPYVDPEEVRRFFGGIPVRVDPKVPPGEIRLYGGPKPEQCAKIVDIEET